MVAALASERTSGEAYNLGGQPVRLGEIAELLVRLNGGQGRVQIVPYPPDAKNVEVGDYVADIRKIRDALGFEPAVSLEEGFARTLEYYRAHRAHYW
jgi:UDP-glucose 4-epimerase